jgi:phosphatidylinositol kinase/protein kinase (PI-3  family)
VGRLIHHLLIDIGKHHPQALVYPLTVASKSASMARRNAANKILKNMCEHSPVLVQQAVMVTYHFLTSLCLAFVPVWAFPRIYIYYILSVLMFHSSFAFEENVFLHSDFTCRFWANYKDLN